MVEKISLAHVLLDLAAERFSPNVTDVVKCVITNTVRCNDFILDFAFVFKNNHARCQRPIVQLNVEVVPENGR